MSATENDVAPVLKFHPEAYRFIYDALHHVQVLLEKRQSSDPDDVEAHITGQELSHGVKDLALERFGLLAMNVLAHWGIHSTGDVGRMVFEMIERGEMRKTEHDQLSDFFNIFDFDEAFHQDYSISMQ